jgi:hypothetical protein
MSIVPFLGSLGGSEHFGKEFLILKRKLTNHLVDLDLLVREMIIRTVDTIIGLPIALRL